MAGDVSNSKNIPDLLKAIKETYGIEVPDIGIYHPLFRLWQIIITVMRGAPPKPLYSASGSITDEFPFNFAKALSPSVNLQADLTIDVFETAPESLNTRGIKVTVFPVPLSEKHPNGVIVKRGLTFVDKAGNLVKDNLSTEKISDESVIPAEAQNQTLSNLS